MNARGRSINRTWHAWRGGALARLGALASATMLLLALAACGGGDPRDDEPGASGDLASGERAQAQAGGEGGGSGGSGAGSAPACVNPSRVGHIGTGYGNADIWSREVHCDGWNLHELQFHDMPAGTTMRQLYFVHTIFMSHLAPEVGQSRCAATRTEYKILRRYMFNGVPWWGTVEAGIGAPAWDAGYSRCDYVFDRVIPTSPGANIVERIWVRPLPADGARGWIYSMGFTDGGL